MFAASGRQAGGLPRLAVTGAAFGMALGEGLPLERRAELVGRVLQVLAAAEGACEAENERVACTRGEAAPHGIQGRKVRLAALGLRALAWVPERGVELDALEPSIRGLAGGALNSVVGRAPCQGGRG